MSRREELEKEIALMDEQIKNAPADTPPGTYWTSGETNMTPWRLI